MNKNYKLLSEHKEVQTESNLTLHEKVWLDYIFVEMLQVFRLLQIKFV